MNGMALCAGVGGLELGIRIALGERYRTVCHAEWNSHAASTLVARMEDSTLDPAPVCDDIFDFDPRPWAQKISILSAGFPCQPFSNAGSRRGDKDERHIFPRIAEIIREVRPQYVFLENVQSLLTIGGGRIFGDVLRSLADERFDCEWMCLRASDVGAPHRRSRLFVFGRQPVGSESISDAIRDTLWNQPERGSGPAQAANGWDSISGDMGGELADSDSARREKAGSGHALNAGPESESGSGELADSDSSRSSKGESEIEPSETGLNAFGGSTGNGKELADAGRGGRDGGRGAKPRGVEGSRGGEPHGHGSLREFDYPPFPPGPSDRDAWSRIIELHPELAPALVDPKRGPGEQLGGAGRMGGDEGEPVPRNGSGESETKPELRGLDARLDPRMVERADRLRAAGNGVVALQAATALAILATRN